MYEGNDKLYNAGMGTIKDMFNKSKTLQKQREKLLKEHAVLMQ